MLRKWFLVAVTLSPLAIALSPPASAAARRAGAQRRSVAHCRGRWVHRCDRQRDTRPVRLGRRLQVDRHAAKIEKMC